MVLSDKKLSVYIKNGASLKKENKKINILIYDESFFKEEEKLTYRVFVSALLALAGAYGVVYGK